jgi:hypothetical protein
MLRHEVPALISVLPMQVHIKQRDSGLLFRNWAGQGWAEGSLSLDDVAVAHAACSVAMHVW